MQTVTNWLRFLYKIRIYLNEFSVDFVFLTNSIISKVEFDLKSDAHL